VSPRRGHPGVIAAIMNRGGEFTVALGNIFAELGDLKNLSHSVHRVLQLLQFALKIHVFQFVTIHMGFEQLGGKHLCSATMTHRRVEGFLCILDLMVMVAYLWFHFVPLCR
jgi:hypothetical protein